MWTRRRTLALVAGCLPALPGCSFPERDGLADLVLANRSAGPLAASVTVTAGSGDRLLSDAVSLPAGENVRYADPIPDGVAATVTVSVEDGPAESHRWSPESADSRQFYVELRPDDVEFVLGER